MFRFCLAIACVALLTRKVSSRGDLKNQDISLDSSADDWSPYDELHASVCTLSPAASLELLEVLEQECNSRLAGWFDDEKAKSKCARLEVLLEACQVNQKKCVDYERTYEAEEKLLQQNRLYPNVVTLLNHQKELQFDTCKQSLEDRLRRYVDDLPPALSDNFQLFKRSIHEVSGEKVFNKLYVIDDQNLLSHGILAYLKRINVDLVTKIFKEEILGEKILLAEFEHSVETPCKLMTRRLESPIRVFQKIGSDEMMYKRLGFSLNWLENSHLCESILANSKTDLFRDVYKLLLEELPQDDGQPTRPRRTWVEKCLSCVSEPKIKP